MMKQYLEWITKHYPDKDSSLNQCAVAVRKIIDKFPELTAQVGYANGTYHCWAKDLDDNIIDPTALQFIPPILYKVIADRFLERDEIELSTGAIFLREQ